MPEPDDITLLKQYAGGDDAAFTALFERYVNLVHSTAIRQVRNSSHAEEITQAVFILLARKAKSLSPRTVLSGWLYQAARLTAASLIKREIRRQRREQEIYMQSLTEPDTSLWEQISPLLDEAMGRLGEQDRNAIVLRFFENKTPQEVAAKLSLNEVTARKRVSRALEKLRKFFTKRGVDSATATIAGAISGNSVQAVPPVLIKTISATALPHGATASASTLTLVKGALKIMAWTKAKTAIVIGAGLLLAAGTATVVIKGIEQKRADNWREKWNPSYLTRLPPQVEILPAITSRRDNGIAHTGSDGMMGLGNGIALIVEDAYGVSFGRIIFSVPVAPGNYDFFSNIHGNVGPALQQELKKKFGLTAWVELINTNVLVLTVQKHNAPGLKPSRLWERVSGNEEWSSRSFYCTKKPISDLDGIIQDYMGIPVVDQTGLTGLYDIRLKGDSTDEGFKRTVREQLGLQLTPAKMPIEMLVVGTNNPTPVSAPLTDVEFAPRAGSGLQGFWVGTVGEGRGAVHVQMKIAESPDGTFRADVYSPDMYGTNRIPAQVSYDGTTVRVIPVVPVVGLGMFEGWLRNGGREVAGDWIQSGAPTPMTLKQADYSEYEAQAAK